jgi:hypothetical protein
VPVPGAGLFLGEWAKACVRAAGRTQQFFFPAAGTVVGWLAVVGLARESGWWDAPFRMAGAARADEDARFFFFGVLSSGKINGSDCYAKRL